MRGEFVVDLIGNAHIDPVWLWRWQDGLAEVKATFLAALDRMDEVPDFVFTSACAAYFDWIERNAPALFEAVRQRVLEGRFAIVGGFWVQPDCNIPSGESFCRHALYSQRYFLSRFGKVATVGYNVDSFGHNGMLPQICKRSGMGSYVFQRPDKREKDLPASLFEWVSPDGSSVRAFRVPMSYNEWTDGLPVPEGSHTTLVKIQETRRMQRAEGLPMMCFFGVGNHGGGPTIASLKAIEVYREANPGSVRYSGPERYFADAPKVGLARVEGDLQHHASGCYAAHAGIKMLNRRTENQLLTAEKYMALAHGLLGTAYDAAGVEKAWRILMFNQFHDVLAGCCIEAACEDALEQMSRASAMAAELSNAAMQRISWAVDTSRGRTPVRSKGGDWMLWGTEELGTPAVIFNPHSFRVTADVRINKELASVTDFEGNPVPVQIVRGGQTNGKDKFNTLARVSLPAMGYATYWLHKERTMGAPKYAPVRGEEWALDNGVLRVEIDPETGDVASIRDLRAGEELLSAPAHAQVIDESDSDTWAHAIFAFDREVGRFAQPVLTVLEQGPLRATIRVEQRFEDTILRQDYCLAAGAAQVDVAVRMNVRMRHRQVKLCFPLALDEAVPVYSMPYGFIRKPADGLEEPAQQWVAVEGSGAPRFALLNDGKYSFSMAGSVLRMTAVRTPGYADHYGHAQRDEQMEYMDQGEHAFRYAIAPYPESVDAIVRAARLLNQPPELVVETYHQGPLPGSHEGIQISEPRCVAEVFKRAEDGRGSVLRLFNASGDGIERAHIACAGRAFGIALAPQEIATWYLPDDLGEPEHPVLITELERELHGHCIFHRSEGI